MRRLLLLIFPIAFTLTATAASAGCSAPVAVADGADNYGAALVVDVLANDRDADGDALSVAVTGTTCAGAAIEVRGGLIAIEPWDHRPRACTIDYRVSDATGRSATAVLSLAAVTLPAIFADGFEAGSTGRWSETCSSGCVAAPVP